MWQALLLLTFILYRRSPRRIFYTFGALITHIGELAQSIELLRPEIMAQPPLSFSEIRQASNQARGLKMQLGPSWLSPMTIEPVGAALVLSLLFMMLTMSGEIPCPVVNEKVHSIIFLVKINAVIVFLDSRCLVFAHPLGCIGFSARVPDSAQLPSPL